MTKIKKAGLFSAIAVLLLAAVLAAGAFLGEEEKSAVREIRDITSAELLAAETVDIVTDASSPYEMIYSGDSIQADQQLANQLRNMLSGTKIFRTPAPDSMTEQIEHEILFGKTDRALSQELSAALDRIGSADAVIAWGYAYRDGKLAFTANRAEGYLLGSSAFLALVKDGKLSVPSDLWVVDSMTIAEYEEILRAEEEAAKQAVIDALKAKNDLFESEPKLNEGYKAMIGAENAYYTDSPYPSPWVYPAEDQHPRYLITEENVERIKEMMDDPEYDVIFENLKYWAEYDIKEGIFPERVGGSGNVNRYNESILTGISARAMMYLLTGDEEYAYEAIIGIKNAMLTLNYTTDLHMDVYHGASHVMVVLAAVYDWCYPVLTDADKWQMITGSVTLLWPTMEFSYPPTNMNGISGHGTGPQFLRDYMSLAVAFYDEAPDWWELIMGRYFHEYLPVANAQYVNGWISQGTACYAPIKVHVQVWAAYLIKTCAGENFFTEDAALGMQFFVSQIMPNGNYFQTGDGGRTPNGTAPGYAEYFVTAALYNDPISLAWAKHITDDYKKYQTGSIFTMTPDLQLCFISAVTAPKEERYDSLDLVQYFLDPAGQMTARNSWDDDAAVVLMKIGNMSMSNHDAYEHGTFQIYYKGLLAGTSGSYKHYGGDSHYYYLQCTVAHNGLLIFNPAKSKPAEKVGDDITNPAQYYYSGSQHRLSSPSTLQQWNDGSYRMADTTGADWGYNYDGSTKYAYIAGDLTAAYDDVTVEYVSRRMLTVYTGNGEIPMVFFTFDEMISDEDYFEKTFLLHTINEPTVDAEDMSATVINGDGRLVLKSLYGAAVIEKIGGEGKAYWINGYYTEDGTYVEGKNCLDEYTPDDNYQNIWGRVQLRTDKVREKTTNMLTAMYVSDAASTATLDIEKYRNESVYGATAGDSVVMFTVGQEKMYKEFRFETFGTGLYNYYVSGVSDGTWQVLVDGVSVAYALSDNEGGLISFIAPAGEVTLKPGKDVIGANGGKIQYNTGGATLPDDAPYSYNNEEVTPLPEIAYRGEDLFLGWYLTSECLPEDRVYEIPMGYTGTFRVYAKWLATFINEDYSDTVINIKKSNATFNGITYAGDGKAGSSFATKTDTDGVNYLEWIEGSSDSFIHAQSTSSNISTAVADDKSISFTVSIAPEPDKPYLQSSLSLVAKHDVDGAALSSSKHTRLLTTTSSGKVLLGNRIEIASLEAGRITTVRFAIDFKYGQIIVYDEDGEYINSIDLSIPSGTGAANTEELQECYKQYIFYWHGDTNAEISDATMRIYKIKVQDGNIFEGGGGVITASSIVYNRNGGRLSADAPYEYSKFTPTFLPTPTRTGCVFAGWYTTETFDEGTRVAYVPTSSTEAFEVWAKWEESLASETYEGKSFEIKESSSGSKDSISYNAGSAGEPKPGSGFITEQDPDGNTYIKASVGSVNSIIYSANPSYNLTHFTETAISYELDIKKLVNVDLPAMSVSIATSGSSYGQLQIFSIDESGKAKLKGSSTVFASITEDDYTTVRVAVDFAAGEAIAYDAGGTVLDRVTLTLPTGGKAEVQPTTLAEWQRVASNYLFYLALNRSDKTSGAVSSAAIDNIKIMEGNAFVRDVIVGNGIAYSLNGGTLPAGAPVLYNAENGTALPTEVTRTGYAFAGWYTTSVFLESSRTETVGAGATGTVTVYAKWVLPPNRIYYETNGGTLPADAPTRYDAENGTALPADGMTLDGYVFAGWYTTETFDEGTLVETVGKDADAPITVYAKWILPPDTIIYETNGGTLPEGYPEKYDPENGTQLPVPERLGHSFDGWYTTETFDEGTKVEAVGIGKDAPITVYAKWTLPDRTVIYQTNGGTLQGEDRVEYDPNVGMILNTNITKDGYVFGGWYTDETYKTRIHYVLYGRTEGVAVYAKWLKVVTYEDYTDNDFYYDKGQPVSDGVIYNAMNNGVTILTETDQASGNTYLRINILNTGSNTNAVVRTTDNAYNINSFNEDQISFEISFSKIPSVALAEIIWSLQSSSSVGGTGSLNLVRGDANGNIMLAGGSVSIGNVTEGTFTKVRIGVDFAEGTVTAYTEDNEVIDSVTPSAPAGFATLSEWQRADNGLKHHILFASFVKPSSLAEDVPAGILADDIRIVDGSIFRSPVTELPSRYAIEYDANGGILPDGAPSEYDPNADTALPTDVTRAGYIFGGWYTAPTFEDGTEMTAILKGTDFPVHVYAKWLKIVVAEDYTDKDFTVTGSTPTKGSLSYNTRNAGATAATASDGAGNVYVTMKIESTSNTIIFYSNNNYNLTNFAETAISWELDLAKMADAPLAIVTGILPTSSDSANGSATIFASNENGEVRLKGSTKVVATIGETFTTLRITVDFARGTVTAYGEDLEVLDSVKLPVPQIKSTSTATQPTTLAEWQKIAATYMLYLNITKPGDASSATVAFDNIKIVDGRAFGATPDLDAASEEG